MEPVPHSKLYSDDSSPLTMQHSSSAGGGSSVGNGGFGCIEHTVTKFDTLAGVAIKYGVEVTDIKRMNGLTTDLHMFARKSLRIPLPGRHPPSPIMPNGQTSSDTTPPNPTYPDSYNSIRSLRLSSSPQRNISRPISSLRDYYNLTPTDHNGIGEGFEMTQTSTPPLGLHRKAKSEANGFSKISRADNGPVSNGEEAGSETLVRRRKSDVDLNSHTPEMLLKQDNRLWASAGKGLRPKIGNRTTMELDSSVVQAFSGVRKSSSAPSFQNTETNNNNNNKSNSISTSLASWQTSMLNFALDLQAAAITSPLFDGLPKPAKKKPARD